jgi:hypothetical protein
VVLHAVRTVIGGEEVAVISVLGNVMVMTMAKLAQVTDSCKTKATQLIHNLTQQHTYSMKFMASKYDNMSGEFFFLLNNPWPLFFFVAFWYIFCLDEFL